MLNFKSSSLIKAVKRYSNWNVPSHKIVIDSNSYRLAHPIWSLKSAEKVQITHYEPKKIKDKVANSLMRIMRVSYDLLSRYNPGHMDEKLYLRRFIFLETVAGVPGMVGGMLRHLRSLRKLQQDGGWIHHLLEEAENERMHLFTFLQLSQPGILARIAILATQGAFITGFTLMYSLSSSTAHRFVGYLEEEAVKTYTNCLNELDAGKLPYWKDLPASAEAIKYWGLPENAKFRDVLLAIRADEAMHREVNHHLGSLKSYEVVKGHRFIVLDNTIGEAVNDPQGQTTHEEPKDQTNQASAETNENTAKPAQ